MKGEMDWACSTNVYMRNVYEIFVGKPEEKGQVQGPRRRCEYNIRMDLKRIRWEILDWILLDQDRDQGKIL